MSNTTHVYPINDLIEHDTETDDCICGPTIEHVTSGDGSDAWLTVHHAIDGRD